MIDRKKINELLNAMEQLSEESVTLSIEISGDIHLRVYPKDWWMKEGWKEEKRHKILALLTPFVGKLEKVADDGNIGYKGQLGSLSMSLNYVEKCKILGYKKVIKTVKKEIDRQEPEYEEVEEEVNVAITDCDVRQGKYSKDDIEVPA